MPNNLGEDLVTASRDLRNALEHPSLFTFSERATLAEDYAKLVRKAARKTGS